MTNFATRAENLPKRVRLPARDATHLVPNIVTISARPDEVPIRRRQTSGVIVEGITDGVTYLSQTRGRKGCS